MDFGTTARLLMSIRDTYGGPFHYRFDESGILHIELVVNHGVPEMFDDARKMFEPGD